MSGRKVFVSSDMSVDERLLLVSERQGLASLLWPWLLTALDDWGRCEAAPLRLKARVWPMNDAVSVALVAEALELFAEVGLIERYTVEGRAYLRIPPARWWKWQTHIHKDKREEDRSRLPAPDGEQASERPHERANERLDTGVRAGVSETPRERAGARGVARTSAEVRGTARDSVPSPSLSLTPSPTEVESTEREIEGEQQDAPQDAVMAADAALSPSAPPARKSSSPNTGAKVTPLRAPSARIPDPVWDACIAAMGAPPSNHVERGRWAKGIVGLKESLTAALPPGVTGITAEVAAEIGVRSRRYRARYGAGVPLNPMALAGNWTALATDIQPDEGSRHHGQHTASRFNGQSAAAGRGSGRDARSAGRPAIGTPAYYAQAGANAHGGGAASESGVAAAVGEW